MTFAVSAEPTVPSMRPHSLNLDVVGFDVIVGWDAMFLTPTTTVCRFSSEISCSITDCGMCSCIYQIVYYSIILSFPKIKILIPDQ